MLNTSSDVFRKLGSGDGAPGSLEVLCRNLFRPWCIAWPLGEGVSRRAKKMNVYTPGCGLRQKVHN